MSRPKRIAFALLAVTAVTGAVASASLKQPLPSDPVIPVLASTDQVASTQSTGHWEAPAADLPSIGAQPELEPREPNTSEEEKMNRAREVIAAAERAGIRSFAAQKHEAAVFGESGEIEKRKHRNQIQPQRLKEHPGIPTENQGGGR